MRWSESRLVRVPARYHSINFEFDQPFRIHEPGHGHDCVYRADIGEEIFPDINRFAPTLDIGQEDSCSHHVMQP